MTFLLEKLLIDSPNIWQWISFSSLRNHLILWFCWTDSLGCLSHVYSSWIVCWNCKTYRTPLCLFLKHLSQNLRRKDKLLVWLCPFDLVLPPLYAYIVCVFLMPVCSLVVDIWLCCRAEHLGNSVINQCCGREHFNSQIPLAHRSNCIICSTRVIAHTIWCSTHSALSHTLLISLSGSHSYTNVR